MTAIQELKGCMLLQLIKEHREKCKGDCNISVYFFKEVFEWIVGRKATDEELKFFL